VATTPATRNNNPSHVSVLDDDPVAGSSGRWNSVVTCGTTEFGSTVGSEVGGEVDGSVGVVESAVVVVAGVIVAGVIVAGVIVAGVVVGLAVVVTCVTTVGDTHTGRVIETRFDAFVPSDHATS
jgi:hypothetical protein